MNIPSNLPIIHPKINIINAISLDSMQIVIFLIVFYRDFEFENQIIRKKIKIIRRPSYFPYSKQIDAIERNEIHILATVHNEVHFWYGYYVQDFYCIQHADASQFKIKNCTFLAHQRYSDAQITFGERFDVN